MKIIVSCSLIWYTTRSKICYNAFVTFSTSWSFMQIAHSRNKKHCSYSKHIDHFLTLFEHPTAAADISCNEQHASLPADVTTPQHLQCRGCNYSHRQLQRVCAWPCSCVNLLESALQTEDKHSSLTHIFTNDCLQIFTEMNITATSERTWQEAKKSLCLPVYCMTTLCSDACVL